MMHKTHAATSAEEAAILAGLRWLALSMGTGIIPSDVLYIMTPMENGAEALTAQQVEELGDALSSDTWIRFSASAPDVAADPLAALDPALRAWLVDEMGMEAEMAGGGAFRLHHTAHNDWSVIVTEREGGGLPDPDCWAVGVYPPGDGEEARQLFYSNDGLTLRQAVAAACSIALEGETAREGGAFYVMRAGVEAQGPYASYRIAERVANNWRKMQPGVAWNVEERSRDAAQFAVALDVAGELAEALENLTRNAGAPGTIFLRAVGDAEALLSSMGVDLPE